MKIKNLILFTTVSLSTLCFFSCKKDNNTTATDDEIATTIELSGNDAISENITDDANDILMETSVSNNFSGSAAVNATRSMNILGCATVTLTPLQGFPKTITIDFGSGCTNPLNQVTRKGIITIVVSDSIRKTGSIAVMSFTNYYVDGFKKEGTITWTNTSQAGNRSWQRKCDDGKITAPDGRYWLHNGVKNITQTAGISTPWDLTDDVYSITGTHTVTNAAGKSRTSTIVEPLEKKTNCANVDKGTVKIEGAKHVATIDFGNGTCDKLATVSIDGITPITILLR